MHIYVSCSINGPSTDPGFEPGGAEKNWSQPGSLTWKELTPNVVKEKGMLSKNALLHFGMLNLFSKMISVDLSFLKSHVHTSVKFMKALSS